MKKIIRSTSLSAHPLGEEPVKKEKESKSSIFPVGKQKKRKGLREGRQKKQKLMITKQRWGRVNMDKPGTESECLL